MMVLKLCSWKRLLGVCVAGVAIALTLTVLSNVDNKGSTTRLLELGRSKLNSVWPMVGVQDETTKSKIKLHHQRGAKKAGPRQKPSNFRNKTTLDPCPELPPSVIDGVEKFVFFIGYPRSGHSIVGSLMDAHPNMIIAHQFMIFKHWKEMEEQKPGAQNLLRDKSYLFNALYKDSYKDATTGLRTKGKDQKGYTLEVGSLWQGKYKDKILVIGDKSGGGTTFAFIENQKQIKEYYQQLLETVNMPVRVIHVVRNPYDMIATAALYEAGQQMENVRATKWVMNQKSLLLNNETRTLGNKFSNESLLENMTALVFNRANAVMQMSKYFGAENVLEIHNGDLVKNPKGTLRKICVFLHIDCPRDYVKAAANKVFKSVSKTREVVEWPLRIRALIEKNKQKVPFFRRYSFESD